jgi:hypothetical protein
MMSTFIIKPNFEEMNSTFYSTHLPIVFRNLNTIRHFWYFSLAVYFSRFLRIFNTQLTYGYLNNKAYGDSLKRHVTHLLLLITRIIRLNKLYLDFLTEEKRNSEINTLLTKIPHIAYEPTEQTNRFKCIPELETIKEELTRLKNRDIKKDPKLIRDIQELIDKDLEDNVSLKAIKEELDKIGKDCSDLTDSESEFLANKHMMIQQGNENCLKHITALETYLSTAKSLNDYLNMKNQ